MNKSSLYAPQSFTSLSTISADRRRTLEMLSRSSNGNGNAGLSAQHTSCDGTTASADMSATPDGAELSVESHRGNTADFSVGPGGASLSVIKRNDPTRPSRSEFLAALQANFAC